jgi:hypothetical protein
MTRTSTSPDLPTLDEWRALFEAALAFKAEACWTWMTDSMLFGVQNPGNGEIGYCCILGHGGISYGMNLYLGTRGLLGYSGLIRSGRRRRSAFDDLYQQYCHTVSFEDRTVLEKGDLAVIKALGLKLRGAKAWPLFRDYLPGYYPWFLTAAQAGFLTIALEQARDVALRVRNEPDLLLRGTADEFLVRRLELADEGMRWVDEYLAPAAPERTSPLDRSTLDHALLERISRNITARTGTWEVDHRFVPTPIQQNPHERPYFPRALTIVDAATGFVFHTHLSDPREQLSGARNEVLRVMSRVGTVPSVMHITRPDVMDIVLPVANALAIDVQQMKRLPETERFHREMGKMMQGRR